MIKKFLSVFWKENMRVIIQFGVGILILLWNPSIDLGEPNIFVLLARKLALVTIAAAGAHFTWKNLMYYITTENLYKDSDPISATKLIAVNIFRGLYYLAWILGISMGL